MALVERLPAEDKPQRIVSTAPSITEALFALGLGDRVVGVSRFCNFPASAQKLPKVGTYLAPDAEAIARLVPDLVVLQRISSELTDRLTALHVRFIEVPHGTLNDVYTGVLLIAKAAGVPERANILIEGIQRQLTEIQEKSKGLPSPRVLAIVNHRPGMLAELTAVGPGNYLEELLEIAGGRNVLAQPGLPMYPRISLETVLRDDPDVILDLSGEQESEAERKAAEAQVLSLWGQQSQLTAVRRGRVIVGTSNALLVPGPRAPIAAQMLFDFMHSANSKGRAR
ncbi:helical backbone metal receptor [Granulicella sp. 5B5]|uniref:ABC transporter substrate-binding protein n=1 Tax=Granulicella sp. 5B5 TaxID=1617967 RepID=UPI0015F561AE|nr:helical backbone metal receptor [Granulicella sp. 5B5]